MQIPDRLSRLLPLASLLGTGLFACGDPTSTTLREGRLRIVQAPPPTGLIAAPFLDTVRVRLIDQDGVPMAGQPLNWAIRLGAGSLTVLDPVTNTAGESRSIWTLGPVQGPNQLTVGSLQDSTLTFQAQGDVFKVDRLDASYTTGCGLQQGNLWCWGVSAWSSAPVSRGPANMWGVTFKAPGVVDVGQDYVDLAVGSGSMCALTSSHVVRCFDGNQRPPVMFVPAVPAISSLAGSSSSLVCGLAVADSTAWCWNGPAGTAAKVGGSPAFVELAIHSGPGGTPLMACGRQVDSSAACWGAGPLGNGTTAGSATPVLVRGGHRFAELAAGIRFACGRKANGEVWCWGENTFGALGAPGPDALVPVLAATGVSRIAAGHYTVLALQRGTVIRWGEFGTSLDNPPTPLASAAGLAVTGFSSSEVSCLHLADRSVYCYEELWLNATSLDIDRYLPVQPVVLVPIPAGVLAAPTASTAPGFAGAGSAGPPRSIQLRGNRVYDED